MTHPHSDTIEIGYVGRTIVRGWRVLLAVTGICIALSVVVILYAPRRYTAKTTVILKSGSGGAPSSGSIFGQGGLGDLTAGLLGGKSPIETEVEVLKSRALGTEVVDSLLLQARAKAETPIAPRAVLRSLEAPGTFEPRKYKFERVADGRYRFVGGDKAGTMVPGEPVVLDAARATFATALPERFTVLLVDEQDAVTALVKNLKTKKEKGDIASITYTAADSATAAAVPNVILDRYLTRRRTTDRGVNQRRLEFLMARADSLEHAVSEATSQLRRQQEQSGLLDPKTTGRMDLERASYLRSRLSDVQVEQGMLNQLLDQIRRKAGSPRDLAAFPRFTGSPVINGLVSQLSEFDTRRTMLLASREETDRDVVALDKSAAAAEAKLVPYAQTYGESLQREREALEKSLATITSELERIPRAAESAGQMEREVLDLSKIAALLQGQIVEAKLATIGEGGDVHPLDLAEIPKRPSFPDPAITAGVGTFGGLFFGIIAALLVGSVGRWVRDPVEVERSTGVPALEFDPAVPLLLSNGSSRTIVVAPITPGVPVQAVVARLAQTASSRSLSPVVLELPLTATDVNGSIARLEAEHDLVVVQLPSLTSDSAAAVLQHSRPVFLVGDRRRMDRRLVVGAVQLLRRLEVPVAGIVMSNGEPGGRALKG